MKKILLFFGALLLLFLLVNYVVMPLYVKHSDTAKVPKVTGLNFLEAKQTLDSAGLEVMQGEVKFDENIPIGQVIDQNPPAGETVKYGRRVYLTLCGGEQLSEVPNLVGKSLRDAKFTLEQRGLKLGETVRKNTNEFPEDFVVSQIVQPGSKLKKNSQLDLILSDGPVIGDLKVPNVTGKNLEEAKKIISDSKLKLGKITYQSSNELPPGQIIDQYPKTDKSANENTTVDLFVAKKKVVVKYESDEEPGDEVKTDEGNTGNDGKANTGDVQKEKPTEASKESTDKNKTPTIKPDIKSNPAPKENPEKDNK